jgi:hypothetical protein
MLVSPLHRLLAYARKSGDEALAEALAKPLGAAGELPTAERAYRTLVERLGLTEAPD